MEDRLKKFAKLVDAGSFTKASRELHISQPALSTAIAKLERELKAPLLARGARPLALTSAGKLAYQAAKDLAVQTDNLKLRLSELSHQPVALRVGMIDSVANVLFAGSSGLEILGDAKVSVIVNNSRYLAELVERGDLDIAFIAAQQKRWPSTLEVKIIAAEPLVVVSNSKRKLKSRTSLPDFIGYDQPSNTFRLVSRALVDYGVVSQTRFYSTSPEVMLRLVVQDKGIAALPYLMVREHLTNGHLKRLGTPKPWLIPRPIAALKRRDKELPLGLKQLIGQAAKTLDTLMAEATDGQV